MKMKMRSLFVSLALVMGTTAAHASDTSLGLAAGIGDFGYRDTDPLVLPLPMIDYEYNNFFIHNLNAGYYLWNDTSNKFAVNVWYNPLSYNHDDTDNEQMKQLNNRHSTAMAGLTWTHLADWGVIRTAVSADILGNSDGVVADVGYLYPIHSGNWTVVPGIGVTWNSSDQNNYYYGISHDESVRSGYSEYSADDSWNPWLELAMKYQINENWHVSGLVRAVSLSNNISGSPMVDNDLSTQAVLGVAYDF